MLTKRYCRTNFPLRSKFAAERGVKRVKRLKDPLALEVWDWYVNERFSLIQSFINMCESMAVLAEDAERQRELIIDCPIDEVWYRHAWNIKSFHDKLGKEIDSDIAAQLIDVVSQVEGLSDSAWRSDDYQLFSDPEWQPVREDAQIILAKIQWKSIVRYTGELLDACKAKRRLYKRL